MITENLSTLKIHKLTQRQYDREVEAGRIDENALYLIPDESGAAIEAFEAHIEDSTKHIDSTERTKWDTASTTASSAQTKANEAYALAESKVPTTRRVNNKALSADITLNASDVGADATGTAQTKADAALASAKTYTDGKIANLLNNSSEAVDSIMELAEAMEENADVVEALESAIGNKVDKVSGKGLSTNDLTATLKTNYDAAYSHVSNKNNPHGVTLSQLGVNATATELNYVDGVTSGIQSQLDAKVPTTRTVNGKALSSNITLSASDVGADSAGTAQTKADAALVSANNHTDEKFTTLVGDTPVATQIETAINAIPQADLAQTDPLAPDYIKNKPTNEDIVQMLMEMDIVQPVSDANNVVYADIDGKAFVL